MRDALGAVAAGCSAIGLNFYENSRRCVSLASSEAIIRCIGREVKIVAVFVDPEVEEVLTCLLYTSPSPRDGLLSRMPSSA